MRDDIAAGRSSLSRAVDVVRMWSAYCVTGPSGRPDSSVTQYADHVLTTSTARESELRPAAMSSRTSQLLVVDCLFVGVAQRTYETAAPALSSSYEALAHRHRGRT